MAEHADEDLLGHVFAILARNAEKPEDPQYLGLMTVQQGLQRAHLALLSRSGQGLVARLGIRVRGQGRIPTGVVITPRAGDGG